MKEWYSYFLIRHRVYLNGHFLCFDKFKRTFPAIISNHPRTKNVLLSDGFKGVDVDTHLSDCIAKRW